MKLLRLIHTFSTEAGGPIEGIRQISPLLKDKGVSTTIATLDAPETETPKSDAYEIIPLGPTKPPLGSSRAYDKWLSENIGRYDAAIVHGLWLYNGYGFWKANRKYNIPYFLYPHGMLDPWFKRTYPLKHFKKSIYWKLRESKLARNAHHLLFTSEEEKRLARESFRPYSIKERVIKYGIALPAYEKTESVSTFERIHPAVVNRTKIVFLSRIHEKKGCDLLINAFADAVQSKTLSADTCLIIAGPCSDQQYLTSLKTLCTTRRIDDRVIWTGMLQGSLKYGCLQSADLFVLPSHQENFGIAVTEALSCGIPVLTTKAVNIWREIHDSGAGIIAEDNQTSISQGLTSFFQQPESIRTEMKQAAATCFLQNFHIQAAANDLHELLSSILEKAHT